jgi:hypothetical protein
MCSRCTCGWEFGRNSPARSPTATVIGSIMTPYYHCQERGSATTRRCSC